MAIVEKVHLIKGKAIKWPAKSGAIAPLARSWKACLRKVSTNLIKRSA